MLQIEVGDWVQIGSSEIFGRVRFVGTTEFSEGDWVGVEIDHPSGKNDGSVQGVRYFDCRPAHGLFVRPKQVFKREGPGPCGPGAPRSAPASRSRASGRFGSRPKLGAWQLLVPRLLQASRHRQQVAAAREAARWSGLPSEQDREERRRVQRQLAEAVENHCLVLIRRLLPRATSLGVPARELEGAWRILDFEIDRLHEVEAHLRQEAAEMLAHIAELESRLAGQGVHGAGELGPGAHLGTRSRSTAATDAQCELRAELRAASLAAARAEGELTGQRRMAEGAVERMSAELRAEASAAESLRVTASQQQALVRGSFGASGQAPAVAGLPEVWLAAVTQAITVAVQPLLEQLQQGLPAAGAAALAVPADPATARRQRKSSHRLPKLCDINWTSQVAVPERYQQRAAWVEDTHRRAITLGQLEDLGVLVQRVLESLEILDPRPESGRCRITWPGVNLYHINELFVLPLTRQEQCSFVELIAGGPQEPRWFISHWWGTPFRDSLCMLGFHSKVHQLPKDTPYWMCTFANNQHNLEELDQRDLMMTPFARAIMSSTCEGTIMLMNNTAEPFKRTWCTLENFISTTRAREGKEPPQLLEVAAVIPEGEQVVQEADGACRKIPRSPALLKDDRRGNLIDKVEAEGAWFPAEVARRGAQADIAKAGASNEEDKRNILRLIIGVHEPDEMPQPPASHPRYDDVNRAIHSVFAPRALYEAAQDGDIAEAQRILEEQLCSPDLPNSRGETPLWTAAFHGHAAAIKLLLAHLADPDRANSHGATAAYAAAAACAVGALSVLLQARANPDLSNEEGVAPIFWAAQEGQVEVLELLLAARADPDVADNEGCTAAHMAALKDHEEVLELLLEASADPDRQNSHGATATFMAAQGNNIGVLELLLEAHASPNQPDSDGSTPLSWAAYHGCAEAVRLLLCARADVNTVVGCGQQCAFGALRCHGLRLRHLLRLGDCEALLWHRPAVAIIYVGKAYVMHFS